MISPIIIPYELVEKKTYLYDANGERIGEIILPKIFSIPVRRDLIRRAFLSAFTAMIQPKGRDPLAGRRTTARSWGVGYGVARVPRLRTGRAMFVSFARGGHLAFAPRPDRVIHEEINKKERIYAILSALSATSVKDIVRKRGHLFEAELLPVIITDDVEDKISKTREAREFLVKIGVWKDIERSYERIRIRAGRGKMRGRRYVEPRSVLFILTNYNKSFAKAVRNFPGVDVATPGNLSILHLAPGGEPGRLTVFTKTAFEEIARKYRVITL
uniref:Large ribosomal subunit protein uL4 n=1 Tax=Staphylothermus marinus TaxID=2280 RepID=A0A7J3PK27_STAMA